MHLAQIEALYGPQVPGESGLKRLCRLQQSWFRVERLRDPDFGPYEPGKRVVGSALVGGEATANNFLSTEAFAYACAKLEEKKTTNPSLLIREFRLFNNMLTSQTMCFNLFSDLRAGVVNGDQLATRILAAMFPDLQLRSVFAVEVEHLPPYPLDPPPRPAVNYIHDKTAFDASICFDGPAGPGVITIETKYTDSLGKNSAAEKDLQTQQLESWGVCTPAGLAHIKDRGLEQIARNLLLTLAFEREHGLRHAVNYVVGLERDSSVRKAVDVLRVHLAPAYREKIQVLPLERIVARALAIAAAPYSKVLHAFKERYLDLSPAESLLRR